MHHKYHTESALLATEPKGEADMYMTFFTRELGLVRAQARGVRYLKSKLRFSLQPQMWPHISLVQGKGMWQVTNAHIENNHPEKLNKNAQNLFERISRLIRRLIQGEEKNDDIFDVLQQSYLFLGTRKFKSSELKNIECIIVLRILNLLGYISDHQDFVFCAQSTDFNEEMIEQMDNVQRKALSEINRAIKASHL